MVMKLRFVLKVQSLVPTNRLSTAWIRVKPGLKFRRKLRLKLDQQLMLKVVCTVKMLQPSTVMINLRSNPRVPNSSKMLQLLSVLMHQLKVKGPSKSIRIKEQTAKTPKARAILTSKDYTNTSKICNVIPTLRKT